jgi:hypothetical protein
MTTWGYLLLAAFVVLGLTDRTTWRRAGRAVVIVTALLMVVVFANYGALH